MKCRLFLLMVLSVLGVAQAYDTSDLVGDWYLHSIQTQRNGQPDDYWFDTGVFHFAGNGTFTGTMADPSGSWPEDGTFAVDSAGIVSLTFSGGQLFQAVLNASKHVMVSDYQDAEGFILDVYVKKGGSYSVSDLAGTWYWRSISVPQDDQPDSFGYENGVFTFQPDGSFSGTITDYEGYSWHEEGTASVSADGIVTIPLAGEIVLETVLDAGKDVMVDNWYDSSVIFLDIFVKKGSSYSVSDLRGTWHLRSIGTQRNGQEDNFGYDTAIFTFQSDGSFTGTMTDDQGDNWPEKGKASVRSDGTVKLKFSSGGGTLETVLNASKDLMIDNYDGETEFFLDVWVKVAAEPEFSISKCVLKAGKSKKGNPGRGVAGFILRDSIAFSGLVNASASDLINTDEIIVTVDSADMPVPYVASFDVPQGSVKKGKYTSPKIKPVLKTDPKESLKIDGNKGTLRFSAKNIDLTGLNCPMSVTVEIGNYVAHVQLDEFIVNGKKPVPIQFMMGVKDTLPPPLKIKAKNGKKDFTDSLAVKGGFSLKDEPSPITSMTLFLGDQPFDLPDGAGTFTYKREKKTSKIKSVAYKTNRGETPQIKAKFDFVKCSYSVSIKKAELETTSGQTTFGVLIDMALSDSDYNKSVEVDLD